MALKGVRKQCPNGHWYDSSTTSVCPQCAVSAAKHPIQEYGATMPINGIALGGLGETQSANKDIFHRFPPTEPVEANASNSVQGISTIINFDDPPAGTFGATVPTIRDYDKDTSHQEPQSGGVNIPIFNDNFPPQNTAPEDIGVTTVVGLGQGNFNPVVGWLVCIEGSDRGRDYRIHTGYNSIGCSPHMDIYIAGDSDITRERHAKIAYDPDEKMFYLALAEGQNLMKLNGKVIMAPVELHAYDIISIHKTKLMFVPFCGERFNWDD